MPIRVHAESQTFHLFNNEISYIVTVCAGYPVNVHFGARVPDEESYDYLLHDTWRASSVGVSVEREACSLEHLPLECPFAGSGDMRTPMIEAVAANGSRVMNLVYQGYEVVPGKPALAGLPATYAECDDEAETH